MTNYTWNNPVSGNWGNLLDWSPHTGAPPSFYDTAKVAGTTRTELDVTNTYYPNDLFLLDPRATLNVYNSAANLQIQGNTYYQSAGAVNVYNDGHLLLDESGADLHGGSLSVSSGGEIVVDTVLKQDGGTVTLGRNGELYIEAGYWDIENNGGISQTGASLIANTGTLEKTGGAGTSLIAGRVDNDGGAIHGEISVSSGKLEFRYDVTGDGSADIHGATLEFDQEALFHDVEFFGTAGGTLSLQQPQNFSGKIYDFVHGDTVKLLQGAWHETAYFHSGGVTTLTLAHDGVSHNFEFGGDVTGINVHPGAITTITRA